MDKKLKDAIKKGETKKRNNARKENRAEEERTAEYKRYILSQFPKAHKWIKNVLFQRIAEAIEYNESIVRLDDQEDGIPAVIIYEAAKEIDGLIPSVMYGYIFDGDEYVGRGDPLYTIRWKGNQEE